MFTFPRKAAVGLVVAGLALASTAAAASNLSRTTEASAALLSPVDVLDRAPIDADGNWKVIVAYEGGLVPDGVLDLLTELGVVRGLEFPTIGAVAVTAPLAVVQAIALDDRVIAIHPQGRVQLHLYASVEQINARGVEVAEQYQADLGDGSTGLFDRPAVTGDGVTVAIIDSGVAAVHPDVGGTAGSRIKLGLNFSFSEIQDEGGISYEQWDDYAEASGTLALQDEIGHGTHVASTVGGDGSLAASEGSDLDLRGVAPGVDFVAMRIATPGFGIVDDIDWEEAAMASLDYTRRHAEELGIRVVNNSWGILPAEPSSVPGVGEISDYDAVAEMAKSVWDAGVTLVFSAGNDGPEPGTIKPAPGGLPAAITVAAACKAVDGACAPGGITGFSSRGVEDGTGNQADIAAPGDTIMAALSPSILAPPPLNQCPAEAPAGYFCISGTSMASPHVAGVAALMYEANPVLTPDQVKLCMTSTADDMLEPGWDIDSGAGMVNTRRAIECGHQLTGPASVGGTAVPPPVPPAPAPTPEPEPEPSPEPLPATGGGLAILALVGAAASGLRRR